MPVNSLNVLYVVIGAVGILIGGAMLLFVLIGGHAHEPKGTAMLIAGMMIAAFGMLLAGFSIGFATSPPLDHVSQAPTGAVPHPQGA